MQQDSSESGAQPQAGNRLHRWAMIGLLAVPKILPYRLRLAVAGWIMAYIFGPIAGYGERIRANLAFVMPDLPEREVRRMIRAVPANTGRMLTEISAPERFKAEIRPIEMQGPGLPALDAAREAGRPIVIPSGHFGNFDAARCALVQRGHKMGALYRPVDDPAIDKLFHDLLTGISEPVFPRGRKGLGQMVRFLRQGNAVAILLDQYVYGGAPLTFFGKPAPTSLSAAEMALKYDALLIPVYGIRRGRSFDIIADNPIPHSDPLTMTQAINDSLEAQVRQHMDQWLWIHRRWKPELQSSLAAESIGPIPSD